jgi:hypothetical protein
VTLKLRAETASPVAVTPIVTTPRSARCCRMPVAHAAVHTRPSVTKASPIGRVSSRTTSHHTGVGHLGPAAAPLVCRRSPGGPANGAGFEKAVQVFSAEPLHGGGEVRLLEPAVEIRRGWFHTTDWSPDARSLIYARRSGPETELTVIELSSGAMRVIARLQGTVTDLAWSHRHDRIAYVSISSDHPGEVHVVRAAGGTPVAITRQPRGVRARFVEYPPATGPPSRRSCTSRRTRRGTPRSSGFMGADPETALRILITIRRCSTSMMSLLRWSSWAYRIRLPSGETAIPDTNGTGFLFNVATWTMRRLGKAQKIAEPLRPGLGDHEVRCRSPREPSSAKNYLWENPAQVPQRRRSPQRSTDRRCPCPSPSTPHQRRGLCVRLWDARTYQGGSVIIHTSPSACDCR